MKAVEANDEGTWDCDTRYVDFLKDKNCKSKINGYHQARYVKILP